MRTDSSISFSQFDFPCGSESTKLKNSSNNFAGNQGQTGTATLTSINIVSRVSRGGQNRLPSLNNQQNNNFSLKESSELRTLDKKSSGGSKHSQQGVLKGISLTESHEFKYNPPQEKVDEVIEEEMNNIDNKRKSKLDQSGSLKGMTIIQYDHDKINQDEKIIEPNKRSSKLTFSNKLRQIKEQKRDIERKKALERKKWEDELLSELHKRDLESN